LACEINAAGADIIKVHIDMTLKMKEELIKEKRTLLDEAASLAED
jgi:hypothetical protein